MDDDVSAELLQKVRSGDEAAARQFFHLLHPAVFKIVRNHLPVQHSEEDLCQMIFSKVFSKLDQYSGRVPVAHWVSRIAVNTCLNEIKRHKNRREIREADLGDEERELLARLADPSHDNEQSAADACELAGKLLAILSPEDRLIISLLHIEECPVAEISALTGFSTASVKIRAFRARKKLTRVFQRLIEAQTA